MSEQRAAYNVTQPIGRVSITDEITPTTEELNLLKRLRQAAGQGRLVVVDPDAKCWYLCGAMERGRESYRA